MDTARQNAAEEPLFRHKKRQLGVRTPEVVKELVAELCVRAGDVGCGAVSRDELVAALIVAADSASDEELRAALETYRQTRAPDPVVAAP